MSLRAGLIGLGAMGRNHARVLSELDGVELAGVLEPAGEPGRAARGAPVVRDLTELLALGIDYAGEPRPPAAVAPSEASPCLLPHAVSWSGSWPGCWSGC